MPVQIYKHTFQELRDWALRMAGTKSHFDFTDLGHDYKRFWDDINRAESERGLDPEEYVKPGTPALCEMVLLKEKEFEEWKGRFRAFHRKKQREDVEKAILEQDYARAFEWLLLEIPFVPWPAPENESFQKEKVFAEVLNKLMLEGKMKTHVMLTNHAKSYVFFYNPKRYRPY